MNKTLLSLAIVFSIFACKKDSKKEVGAEELPQTVINKDNLGVKQLKGEFIYYADAAVLQTPTEVYGVVIDSMMHVLESQVKEFKKETTDMVPVAVKGKVSAKPEGEEGWPYRVEILEVLDVYEPKVEDNNVIKIEKQTK
jgi:hypothetical protein